MMTAAVVLLAIGSGGVIGATIMESRYREPKYKLMMKLFPWAFGLGGVLLGIAMAGG